MHIKDLSPYMKCFLPLCFVLCWIYFFLLSSHLTAQGSVCAKQECMDPSVMNATQVSSTSAPLVVDRVSVTTTPATATHNPVSC